MNCVNCNQQINDNLNFCPFCGTAVKKVSLCLTCGSEVREDWKSCGNCGDLIAETTKQGTWAPGTTKEEDSPRTQKTNELLQYVRSLRTKDIITIANTPEVEGFVLYRNTTLIGYSRENSIVIFDLRSQNIVHELNDARIRDDVRLDLGCLIDDGTKLLSVKDRAYYIWEFDGNHIYELETDHSLSGRSHYQSTFNPINNSIVMLRTEYHGRHSYSSSKLMIRQFGQGGIDVLHDFDCNAVSFELSPNNRFLAVLTRDAIEIYDASNYSLQREIRLDSGSYQFITFSHDSKFISVKDKFWDVDDPDKPSRSISTTSLNEDIRSLVIDSDLALTVCAQGIDYWNIRWLKPELVLSLRGLNLESFQFCSNYNQVVAKQEYQTGRLRILNLDILTRLARSKLVKKISLREDSFNLVLTMKNGDKITLPH